MIAGRARITAVDQNGRNFIADVGVGDLWYFPPGIPHSIQGLKEGCEFLLVFDDGNFSDLDTFSLSDWFAHTPKEVLSANFGVPLLAFANIPPNADHVAGRHGQNRRFRQFSRIQANCRGTRGDASWSDEGTALASE